MTIKIALAQIDVIAGQPKTNLNTMLTFVEKAKAQNVDIIIFPELAISGYLLGDLWEYDYFLKECEQCGQQLIDASQNICIIFGNIAISWNKHNEDGRVRKYNACFVAQDRKLIQGDYPYPFRVKTLLPTYNQFDDYRHFFGNTNLALEQKKAPEDLIQPIKINIKNQGLSLGCLICADGWDKYSFIKPTNELNKKNIDFFVNISSSPFHLNKNSARYKVFSKLTKNTQKALLYINHVGVQNNGKNICAYDGISCAYDKQGNLTNICQAFNQELQICTYDTTTKDFIKTNSVELPSKNPTEQIYNALYYSTKAFLQQCNITKIVIGLSGGIDSAVTAALYTHILGPENILLINMPSKFNSQTTINLAEQLAQNLQTNYSQLSIEDSIQLTQNQITNIKINGKPLEVSSYALENIQARDRGARLLAAAAAAFGGAFSCNANKSEITVGYGTFYGDLAGFMVMLGDLWKHQVYDLGRYLNQQIFQKEIIPAEIFDIKPSAELSSQQTVGTGGDPLHYEYHDYLLKAFVEENKSPVEIAQWYKAGTLGKNLDCPDKLIKKLFPTVQDFFADLEKWWLAYNGLPVAKRIQAPPVIAISKRTFGADKREVQLSLQLPPEYLKLKKAILHNKSVLA